MVGKVTPNDQLSASEVPVLMGASRFMTVNELLKQKMDVISGIDPPFTSNESMDWGNKLETTILNESCARLGLGNPKPHTRNHIFIRKYQLHAALMALSQVMIESS